MARHDRRRFLRAMAAAGLGAAVAKFPAAVQRAQAIAPYRMTGTLEDVAHIVVLTQENRSFDHYFGTYPGVRGFGDRFPIPLLGPNGRVTDVWSQRAGRSVVSPFPIDTTAAFSNLKVAGTPHAYEDARQAWSDGRMNEWPRFKLPHSMGYFARHDLPFQFALAEAFTLCDAYHCSFQGSTNPNRMFLFTGTNDPSGRGGGPVLDNDYDSLDHDAGGGYCFVTYAERLEAKGIRWQVYQNADDNYSDNPLVGFRRFRDAAAGRSTAPRALRERGLRTRDVDDLEKDVLAGALPQVAWIIATAEGSEHPGPSSPAQGARYIARVLEALTANPEVWARTVLLINFDENDGFFDHVPPPAVPSYVAAHGAAHRFSPAGASTVDTRGEYQLVRDPRGKVHRPVPFGLGPRVPMYVVSPWSRGGFVCSEVFDHTSIIRFMERRFGVYEPNISPWRRAVCGDLTSAFDFAHADASTFERALPSTRERARAARRVRRAVTPKPPAAPEPPRQTPGMRPSRALPYALHVDAEVNGTGERIDLLFRNTGRRGAVFHVYDRLHLERAPSRFTVESQKQLPGSWQLGENAGRYDLWVLGPNGFHRHFVGDLSAERESRTAAEIAVSYDELRGELAVLFTNKGHTTTTFTVRANAYFEGRSWSLFVDPAATLEQRWSLAHSGRWYDFSVSLAEASHFLRRFAGRMENGQDSFSDPELAQRSVGYN